MKNLTIGEIEQEIARIKRLIGDDYKNVPVYLGDDEELNGVHGAFYTNFIEEQNAKYYETASFIELINERGGNNPFSKNALLIS